MTFLFIANKKILDKVDKKKIESSGHRINLVTSSSIKNIANYDAVIAESSIDSDDLSNLVSKALEVKIRAYLINNESSKSIVLPVIMGEESKLIETRSYKLDFLTKTIQKIIDDFVMESSEKFAFKLTPQISSYLQWISKEKSIDRSTFLRSLIEDKIKKDREYSKMLS